MLLLAVGYSVQAEQPGEKGDKDKKEVKAAQTQSSDQDPLKRPAPADSQGKAKLEKEGKYYKNWLNVDVRWIITDEELSAFKKLATDAERDQFIEQFWQRRDPTPDTEENEYKEEHYRRIQYANEHFQSGMPGWKTDRGRM